MAHNPSSGKCPRCAASELHPFRVKMYPIEGPAWWLPIPSAIGPADAKSQARYVVESNGEDAGPVAVEHAEAVAA